jgi:TatD DNase family protein
MIETHAHLDFPEYDGDRDSVIQRAKASGIEKIINVGTDMKGSLSSVELAKNYSFIYAACGIHPHYAKDTGPDAMEYIKKLIISMDRVVAIGEVGIDLYRNISTVDAQQRVLSGFLKMSADLNLPLIIHCREQAPGRHEASDILFQAMESVLDMPYKGVMHCFSGNEALLKRCLDAGLYISYTCNVTFKGSGDIRSVLKKTPLKRLLLETDSPFLSPQGKRGTRNEPAYIQYLLRSISENTGVPEKEIERQTDRNAHDLFFKIYD